MLPIFLLLLLDFSTPEAVEHCCLFYSFTEFGARLKIGFSHEYLQFEVVNYFMHP